MNWALEVFQWSAEQYARLPKIVRFVLYPFLCLVALPWMILLVVTVNPIMALVEVYRRFDE